MNSLTIELLRFGGSAGIIDPMNNYLVLAGNASPPGARAINLQHKTLLRHLHHLRYPSNNEESKVIEALHQLSREADYLLRLPDSLSGPMQIDLVTSAAELWAFPFEALLHLERFSSEDTDIILTRRVRQQFVDEREEWPSEPRVLFAYASPDYVHAQPVPAESHKTALRSALKPWIEPLIIPDFPSAVPNETTVLTILKEASLSDINNAIVSAHDDGKPYSHIHILAHGIPTHSEYDHETVFGLALRSEENKPVHPDQVGEVLQSRNGRPVCVTLTVCDGGNQSNTIAPGSLAHSLHENGVPIVVASQFPLTMPGSSILTEEFYTQLLNGQDVRQALLIARKALRAAENEGALHDWLSMVAYVQLPEGYQDYLDIYSLKRQFASLRTVQKWADHIVQNNIDDEAALERVQATLHERLDALKGTLYDKEMTSIQGVYEELTGLLGSTYKRLAELQHYIMGLSDKSDEWQAKVMDSMSSAMKYYKLGHDRNLSAHWNGIQHLCLEAVLTGKISDPSYWHTVKRAATTAVEDEKEVWAWGTLAELFLLAPYAGLGPMERDAQQVLNKLIEKCQEDDADEYTLESTSRQLARYRDWWTKEHGFFGKANADLSEKVIPMLDLLNAVGNRQ